MEDDVIKRNIEWAIHTLQRENPVLAFHIVHERSTAHRLAVHMEPLFPGWNIDCEYDRDGMVQKELSGIAGCNAKKKTDTILPDIIVHERTETKNLLVIELKKDNEKDVCDIKKLKLFTKQSGRYKYNLGLYININNGEFDCTWFKNGEEQD